MKSRTKKVTAKAVLIALLVSAAASPFQSNMASSKAVAKKISVTLNKKRLSLKTGQRFRLKAKKKPAKAKVSFSSSKRSVVSVNKTGLVKAKKPGKASITATVKYKGKKKKAVCKVRVVSKKKTINKQIQPSAPAANTQQPAPTATAKPVITDPTATPSAAPKRTPRATKTPSPTPVEITYKADYTVELGSTLDVKKEVKPSEGVITDYNVSTSNNYVAIIDARGKIKPLHIGKCTLILTSKADDTKKRNL
ncbi:MAG: Ig-like domain-containing protein [Clostridium sp.]